MSLLDRKLFSLKDKHQEQVEALAAEKADQLEKVDANETAKKLKVKKEK